MTPISPTPAGPPNPTRWLGCMPQAPSRSSAELGWRHIEAHRFDALRCWELRLPPVSSHFIAAHLLIPCQVRARWNGRPIRGRSVPGNLMLMAAGQDSEWHCSAGIDELHIFLDPLIVDEVAQEIGGRRFELIDAVGMVDPALCEIALRLLGELEHPGMGTRLFADTMARSLALQLLRLHSTARAAGAPQRIEMTARQLRAATDFIEAHLEEDLALGEICAAAAMSAFRFARAFKSAVGQSPRQYVIARRIARAKELLRSSDRALADIASLVGFSTQSHFTAVFHQRCGMTPKRFRDLSRS